MYSTDTPSISTLTRLKSRGFSLMELMVAMMIVAILAVVGYKQFSKQSDKARHIKALDAVRTVAQGLDRYYMKHGSYPELPSWEAMVSANSPLVKGDFILPNMEVKDPWQQDYEATSSKATYAIKCMGKGGENDDTGMILFRPGQTPITGDGKGEVKDAGTGTPAPAAAPQGGAK